VTATTAGAHPAGPGAERVATSPFNVLVVTELSGPYAAFGGAYEPGLFAAGHLINTWGGILGHKIALDFVDDQSSPVTAVSVLQNALSSGKKYGAIVTDLSVFTSSLAPLIAKAGILNPTSATSDSLLKNTPYQTLFTFSANTYAPEQALANAIAKKGLKNVGLVAPPTPSAQGSATILTNYLQAKGISASTVTVPTATPDATPQLQQLQAKGAQAIALLGFSPVVNSTLAARAKLGWNAPVYCDNACSAVDWSQIPSDERSGVLVDQLPISVAGTAATKTKNYTVFANTIAKYDKKFALGMIVDIEAWNIMMTVRAAAMKAKSIDTSKLISTLAGMTQSSSVPWYVGPKLLFSSGTIGDNDWPHAVHAVPGDYIWVPAAPLVGGLMPSGK
jgi:ABC-type branched-subunit amino acid transport system substrate-binding protein